MKKKKILVFGSFVADLMSRGPHLPSPGETVLCSLFQMGPGGKGFNQGVAAHKAGGDVTMVTKIGRDAFGDLARSTMQSLGMDTAHLLVSDTVGTGAGDAFNGGLVTALSEGKDLFAAARFANALAAVSVQRMGTTRSMPTREEIDDFIAAHPELA